MPGHRRFPRVVSGAVRRREGARGFPTQVSSRTLLLPRMEERELAQVNWLMAAAAAAGPAAQDGLQQQHRLRQRQTGRRARGRRRSSVRKAWAQVTSAVWWWKPR